MGYGGNLIPLARISVMKQQSWKMWLNFMYQPGLFFAGPVKYCINANIYDNVLACTQCHAFIYKMYPGHLPSCHLLSPMNQ